MLQQTMQELEKRIQTITAAMQECSKHLRKLQHGDLRVSSKSNPRDLVTRADRESEEILIECIQSHFPEDSILAEESGALAASRSSSPDRSDGAERASDSQQYRWVLDPLDGTVNYTHGSPQYAVSAGIMRDQDCLAGAILHPATGDLYTAIQGGGAFKNGKPISVSQRQPMDQCLVVTGFPYSRQEFLDALLVGIKLTLQNA